jgi:hypothetical protein
MPVKGLCAPSGANSAFSQWKNYFFNHESTSSKYKSQLESWEARKLEGHEAGRLGGSVFDLSSFPAFKPQSFPAVWPSLCFRDVKKNI